MVLMVRLARTSDLEKRGPHLDDCHSRRTSSESLRRMSRHTCA